MGSQSGDKSIPSTHERIYLKLHDYEQLPIIGKLGKTHSIARCYRAQSASTPTIGSNIYCRRTMRTRKLQHDAMFFHHRLPEMYATDFHKPCLQKWSSLGHRVGYRRKPSRVGPGGRVYYCVFGTATCVGCGWIRMDIYFERIHIQQPQKLMHCVHESASTQSLQYYRCMFIWFWCKLRVFE